MSLLSKILWLKGTRTDGVVTAVNNRLVYGIAASSVLLAIFASIYTTPLWIDTTSIQVVFFGAYMAYQKHRLADLGTFRSLHNVFRQKINEMMQENQKLTTSVDQLEVNVSRLEHVEKQLRVLANTNNIDRLVTVVKDMKRTNHSIQKKVQSQLLQNMLTSVLRSDKNMDLKIDKKEWKELIRRWNTLSTGEGGKRIDVERLFQNDSFFGLLGPFTQDTYSIMDIMALLRKNITMDHV